MTHRAQARRPADGSALRPPLAPALRRRGGRTGWTSALGLAAALVAGAGQLPLSAADGRPTTVVFELVPESAWTAGRPDPAAALETGRVFLYRVGEDAEPDLVLPAGEPVQVPPGDWSWIAEADGHVTTEGGVLRAGDARPGAPPKTIVWPVVPACRAVLAEDEDWGPLHRLDLVSLTRSATYPVHPRHRRGLWVPAGRLLAYGVGPTGLTGIDSLGACEAGETVRVPPPAPPDRGHQDFLLPVRPPDPPGRELGGAGRAAEAPFDRRELVVALEPRGRRASGPGAATSVQAGEPGGLPAAPSAALWNPGRYTLFFLDVPTGQDLDLVVRHPRVRTVVREVESLGGSARELEEVRLRRRPDLRFLVDYRPAREHRVERIEVAYCGLRPRRPRDLAACRWLERDLPLEPGVHEVVVEGIDDGSYWVRARVDDELVFGLGHGFLPVLHPEDDAPEVPTEPLLLQEFEVWGHVLDGDEPVRGQVVLVPLDADRPIRRFPTDEELLYRLFYFGRVPFLGQVPEEDRALGEDELLGLFLPSYQLGACDERYYCRYFNPHSTLRGGGRLDLPLGSGPRLEVTVVDGETGEPIAGAQVAVEADRRTLHFTDGDVERGEPLGREATVTLTNANGLARVRLTETDGGDWVDVGKEGYRRRGHRFTAPDDGVTRLRIPLTPESESAGVEVRLADGRPLSSAALLAFGPGGAPDPPCHLATNLHARAEVPRRCARDRTYVVIHPDAAMAPIPAERLAGSGAPVLVDPAPRQPLLIRVLDGTGRPLPGVPVELRLGSVLLDANDLLAAATRTGYLPFYLTDAEGELILRGVGPAANPAPVLVSPLGPAGGTLSLAGRSAGEAVVFEVSPGG